MSILVVDDNAGQRALLTDILQDEGYGVETATNGREALERLTEKTYALVLTDYAMPFMDGETLIREMQRVAPSTPVLMVSGESEATRRALDTRLSAYRNYKGFLAKPFELDAFYAAVRQATGKE
ncbi:response regulator [Candidatus Woesearchaeota archaeon]|nr:MAG: response regulator [Candidatus Woesearchaeota archaeon]